MGWFGDPVCTPHIFQIKVERFLGVADYSRLDNKQEGIIIVVMQRLHQDDLVGHLTEKGGWEVLNLPAIAAFDEIFELENAASYHRKVGEVLQ